MDGFVIPRESAKAFLLQKGQILRITAHEGKQVADVKFINAQNIKSKFLLGGHPALTLSDPKEKFLEVPRD